MSQSTRMAGKRHPKAPWAPAAAMCPTRAPGLDLEGAMETEAGALATEATPAGFPGPEAAGLVARFGRARGGEIAARKHPGRAPSRPPIETKAKQENNPNKRLNEPGALVTVYFIGMSLHSN